MPSHRLSDCIAAFVVRNCKHDYCSRTHNKYAELYIFNSSQSPIIVFNTKWIYILYTRS